jgi:hypothetical protein
MIFCSPGQVMVDCASPGKEEKGAAMKRVKTIKVKHAFHRANISPVLLKLDNISFA